MFLSCFLFLYIKAVFLIVFSLKSPQLLARRFFKFDLSGFFKFNLSGKKFASIDGEAFFCTIWNKILIDPITRFIIRLIRNWTRTRPISWNWPRPAGSANYQLIGLVLVQFLILFGARAQYLNHKNLGNNLKNFFVS